MPKAKKTLKLRDQKPVKDPRGGGGRTAGATGKEQRHGHRGRSRL